MVEVDPHGINQGTGDECAIHSYMLIDEHGLNEHRIASLSKILHERYGVKDERLVTALCALGEGKTIVLFFNKGVFSFVLWYFFLFHFN